jgi:hypothetical protein
MILRLVRGFRPPPDVTPISPGVRAELRARLAREIEGERDRSTMGIRCWLTTEPGRDPGGPPAPPPSLTPPPRTVTLPPSYGVTEGVPDFATLRAVGVSWRPDGDGSRPRSPPGVGVLSSSPAALAATVKGSADPGLDAGVKSWVLPELQSEILESSEEELPLLCRWPALTGYVDDLPCPMVLDSSPSLAGL